MLRPATWFAAIAGSAGAHAVMLAALLFAITPDREIEQQPAQSRIDVDAYELDREIAPEARPDSPRAPDQDTGGAALSPGAVRQSQARQTSPRIEAAHIPDAPDMVPLSGAVARAKTLSAIVGPTQNPTSLKAGATKVATLTSPPVTLKQAALLPAPATIASAVIGQTALPAAPPRSKPAAITKPTAQPAPAARADPDKAEATAPRASRVKAALAFSGADGEIDPVSLAAFQSFTRPGDISLAADPLRDGVAGILAGVPCSRLQVAFDPQTATLQVNGHVPEGDLRAPVLAALRSQMGGDIAVSDNILILPRPQCGALSGIAQVGLPQSTDQITNPLLIGEDTQARILKFVKDDRLFFDITAPDYDAYVYVDYFDAGGDVLHLVPNDQVALERSAAKSALRIGAENAEDAGLQLRIAPPFGQEIAVAFAASAPLYQGKRPLVEPAAPYLQWLKERVAKARAEDPAFRGEWVYFFVSTSEG